MNIHNIFYNNLKQIKPIWRILIFISLLFLAVLPLFLIDNKILQFFGATVILIFGLYANSKYLDKREFSEYGLLFTKQSLLHLLIGLIIGSCAVISMIIIGKLSKTISVSTFNESISILSLLLFLLKMFLVAIIEETFFRGYLYTNFKDVFKSKKLSKKQTVLFALALSSILFGLAHFNNNDATVLSVTLLTVNGLVWCIPFILTKNLGLSIGMHIAWNFTQTQLGFTMSGNKASHSFYSIENVGADLLTGGAYGPESGLLGLLGFGVMLLLSQMYLNYNNINFSNSLKTK